MVLAEGSTPDEAVNLSLITRPLLDGGRGGVERARLDWDFKPESGNTTITHFLCNKETIRANHQQKYWLNKATFKERGLDHLY